MERAIWLILGIAAFCGGVVGGFWIITKSEFGKPVKWAFGGIVLVIILFALVAIVHFLNGDPWRPFKGW